MFIYKKTYKQIDSNGIRSISLAASSGGDNPARSVLFLLRAASSSRTRNMLRRSSCSCVACVQLANLRVDPAGDICRFEQNTIAKWTRCTLPFSAEIVGFLKLQVLLASAVVSIVASKEGEHTLLHVHVRYGYSTNVWERKDSPTFVPKWTQVLEQVLASETWQTIDSFRDVTSDIMITFRWLTAVQLVQILNG